MHVGDLACDIVRILIVLAVSETFHEARGSVAQMERDGLGGGLFDVLLYGGVCGVKRIRLGRDREMDDGLRQSEIALRHADEIHGIARRHAE